MLSNLFDQGAGVWPGAEINLNNRKTIPSGLSAYWDLSYRRFMDDHIPGMFHSRLCDLFTALLESHYCFYLGLPKRKWKEDFPLADLVKVLSFITVKQMEKFPRCGKTSIGCLLETFRERGLYLIKRNMHMGKGEIQRFVRQRYRGLDFSFRGYNAGVFEYVIAGSGDGILEKEELLRFKVRKGAKLYPLMAFGKIVRASREMPDTTADTIFRTTPIAKLVGSWNKKATVVLAHHEEQLGFELAYLLRRLLDMHPLAHRAGGVERMQAVFILQKTTIQTAATVLAEELAKAKRELAEYGIFFMDRDDRS
ncbi:hypothetical protein FKX85_06570 [Echinicola soli]|uniref:Uncharacterized protein n=1 Tax=Echinicola soli TaxID=2591634 RepID=A0A514CFW2_9BACT|nr:hypothetical protein [Echinicola soli]QDH78716.1 hypothetical protein FKX85_06570 [Echinicola soli]